MDRLEADLLDLWVNRERSDWVKATFITHDTNVLAARASEAVMALVSLQNSTDQALDSVRARELRVLAERKMGEIQVFEAEYDDIYDNEDFDDYHDDLYDGWEWSLFIRDVVIFGTTNDEAAEYLFGDPEEDDEPLGAQASRLHLQRLTGALSSSRKQE